MAADLEIQDVVVRFEGLTALDGVTLSVEPGQVLGVIGPNGAGKTTLFNAVCGFVRPESGTIRWRGRPLGKIRPHQLTRLGIARTVQGVSLFPHLSAIENVMVGGDHLHRPAFVFSLLGLPRSDRAERRLRETALAALDAVGATDVADRPADSLPYPVQKRVALARALVSRPHTLLLDEPAGGLGADDVADMAKLLTQLKGRGSVMLVEHRMDFVMSVCDRVAVLDSGRLIAEGPPAQIQSDPKVLEAYLGSEQATERPSVLELEGVVTAYGPVLAVDDVSLDVTDRSITAILGANGAGKTSLLRTISGVVRARSGRVRFEDRDITRMPPEEIVRLGLAHVPEGGGVIGELTVEDNLRLGALWRRDRPDRAKALREVYELFPRLEEHRRLQASSLSGGERQMLSIGRALMGRPSMLLLDEPSLGLAPMIAARIMGLVHDLRERTGLTVLLVEQNAKSALSIADTGVVLNVGRVVATDSSEELAANDQLRQAYLGF